MCLVPGSTSLPRYRRRPPHRRVTPQRQGSTDASPPPPIPTPKQEQSDMSAPPGRDPRERERVPCFSAKGRLCTAQHACACGCAYLVEVSEVAHPRVAIQVHLPLSLLGLPTHTPRHTVRTLNAMLPLDVDHSHASSTPTAPACVCGCTNASV